MEQNNNNIFYVFCTWDEDFIQKYPHLNDTCLDSHQAIRYFNVKADNQSKEEYINSLLSSFSNEHTYYIFLHASDFDFAKDEKKVNNALLSVEADNNINFFSFSHTNGIVHQFIRKVKNGEQTIANNEIDEIVNKIKIPDGEIENLLIKREKNLLESQADHDIDTGIRDFQLNVAIDFETQSILETSYNYYITESFEKIRNNFITEENLKYYKPILEDNFIICFVTLLDLSHKDFLKTFFSFFNKIETFDKKKVLFAGVDDLFELAISSKTKSEAFPLKDIKAYFEELDWLKSKLNIARNIQFIDSNIKTAYYPIAYIEQGLFSLPNHNAQLLKSSVFSEYCTVNKALFNIKLKESDSHGSHITPFIFHSETKMQEETKKLIGNNEEILNLKWKCLLIDDFADVELTGLEGEGLTKKVIISDIIDNENITIDSVSDLDSSIKSKKQYIICKALEKLSEKTYDIILLDYLLGENLRRKGAREYSHELLNILHRILAKDEGYNEKDYSELAFYMPIEMSSSYTEKEYFKQLIEGISRNKGPLGKFWIINISSFQTAFLDRLREQGLGHNSEHWYLSRGGDPVNSPELFNYAFYSFLRLQISQVIITKDILIRFLIQNKLIPKKDDKEIDVRSWSKGLYGAYIYKFGQREIISKDYECNSAFAGSVIDHINSQLESEKVIFYDHLRQLLFQLAYGTGYNIGQTLELYKLVNSELRVTELEETFKIVGNYLESLAKYY